MTKEANYSTQDNEPMAFKPLGLATARVLERLLETHQKKHDEEHENGTPDAKAEKDRASQDKYVDHRLKELARFERRAAGKD